MAEDTRRTPPYVSYKTFTSGIRQLKDHMPDVIDYSIYHSMNGSTRNAYFAALRYFNLIDASGKPSETLVGMAGADDREWKAFIEELVQAYYPAQLQALRNGSVVQLRNTFNDIGPSVVAPACRFLIAAAEDAGLPVSPSILKAPLAPSGPRRKRPRPSGRAETDPAPQSVDRSMGDTASITFPVPLTGKVSGQIIVPSDFNADDLPMFEAMVAAVAAYAKQRSSRETVD